MVLYIHERKGEGRAEIAEEMLRQNRMTIEEVSEMTELPLETVKQLAELISARQ